MNRSSRLKQSIGTEKAPASAYRTTQSMEPCENARAPLCLSSSAKPEPHHTPTNAHQAVSAALPAARELHVRIRLDHRFEYEGSAAQLQDEGLIPQGLQWPAKDDYIDWSFNGFDYALCRTRPKGHKGSMHSWMNLDHWCVRVYVSGRNYEYYKKKRIAHALKAYQDEVRKITQTEPTPLLMAWWQARGDVRFRAFMRLAVSKRTKRTKELSPDKGPALAKDQATATATAQVTHKGVQP